MNLQVGDMVIVRSNSHKIRFLAQVLEVNELDNTAKVEISVTGQVLVYPIEQIKIYNE